MNKIEVLIIGGGLGGLTAGIHLARCGCSVAIVEKNDFPKHKVCGEYVSNEVLPYLQWLDADPEALHPAHINITEVSSPDGKKISSRLPLGGFGIGRFTFDQFLYQKAIDNGCSVIQDTVMDIRFHNDSFEVMLSNHDPVSARVVIGAFGKRSNLDQTMKRDFMTRKSPWLAVKGHYRGDYPGDTVGLHSFIGGYCGLSKVENGVINACYLADYDSFKRHGSIDNYTKNVVRRNPHLSQFFKNSTALSERPLTISQISFEAKLPVENHLLMVGDTAGLINPLCGNGMAMAIHAAKVASELIVSYLKGQITRDQMEQRYASEWKENFGSRIRTGRLLANMLQNQRLTHVVMKTLQTFPALLPRIIRQTHGPAIAVER